MCCKVFETSAEWPHLAAIERERRQRAALAFEQSLRGRNLVLTRQSSRSRQHQVHAPQPARPPGRLHSSDEVLVVQCSAPERPSAADDKQRRIRLRSDPSRRSAPADVRGLASDGK